MASLANYSNYNAEKVLCRKGEYKLQHDLLADIDRNCGELIDFQTILGSLSKSLSNRNFI